MAPGEGREDEIAKRHKEMYRRRGNVPGLGCGDDMCVKTDQIVQFNCV